jgi:hypothetical protein
VNPEPEEVDDGGNDDETEDSSEEVLCDDFLLTKRARGQWREWGEEKGLAIFNPRRTSSKFQRSTTTAVPTAMKAKRPTILQEMVRERKTPVRNIHVHHGRVNSLQRPSVSTAMR